MPNVNLTFETILLCLAVILLLANTVSSLNRGRKDFRELSGAGRRDQELETLRKRVSQMETALRITERRLTEGEETFARITRDTEQIMNVLDGMLLHFISGNDIQKLKAVKEELDHYKNGR